MVMLLLLLLSGDVETNPGPNGEGFSFCRYSNYIQVHSYNLIAGTR